MSIETTKITNPPKYSNLSQATKAINKIKDKIQKLKSSVVDEETKLAEIEEQVKFLEEKEIVAVLRKYEVTLPQLKEFLASGKLPYYVTDEEEMPMPESVSITEAIKNREVEQIA